MSGNNLSEKRRNGEKAGERFPAQARGAANGERRNIRLPENRNTGEKYQIKKQQYIGQSRRSEAAGNNISAEKEADKTKGPSIAKQNAHTKNDRLKPQEQHNTGADNLYGEQDDERRKKAAETREFAENYATSSQRKKAAVVTSKMLTNVELSEKVSHTSTESREETRDRAVQYKEKAKMYLDKMKKNAETGKKEVNENRDKDIGKLYKKAYKLAHKEELLDKKPQTSLYDKAQNLIQVKSEFDNAANQNSVGEAASAAAAVPLRLAADRALKKAAKSSAALNKGKGAAELAARISAEASSGDGVGEAAANSVAAVPKYFVQKKAEKTVQQVMQAQHDKSMERKKERLRQKQELMEKRAEKIKKENMQRQFKVNLYKSEHGITAAGNSMLKNAKAALKAAAESIKNAAGLFFKSPTTMLFGAGLLLFVILLIMIISAVAGEGSWAETDELTYTLTGSSEEIKAENEKEIMEAYVLQVQNCMDVYQAKIWYEVCDWIGAGGTYNWIGGPIPDEKSAQITEGPYSFTSCRAAGGGNGKTDCTEFNDKILPGLNQFGNTSVQSGLSAEELLSVIALAKVLKNNMDQPDDYSYSITEEDIFEFIEATDFVPINYEISECTSCGDGNCRRRLECNPYSCWWVYFCHGHHQKLTGSVGNCKTKDELIDLTMSLYDAESAELSREDCAEICDEYLDYIKEVTEITESDFHYFGSGDDSRAAGMYNTLHQGSRLENDHWPWEILEHTSHTYMAELQFDDTSHWRECIVCGYKTDIEEHQHMEAWTSDFYSHWHECSVCGYKEGLEGHAVCKTPRYDKRLAAYVYYCETCGKSLWYGEAPTEDEE